MTTRFDTTVPKALPVDRHHKPLREDKEESRMRQIRMSGLMRRGLETRHG